MRCIRDSPRGDVAIPMLIVEEIRRAGRKALVSEPYEVMGGRCYVEVLNMAWHSQ
jgi:hypothetical protein